MATRAEPTCVGTGDRERAERFVETCIAERWPGARIAGVDAVRGDASSRRYLRARLEPTPGPCPETLVIMLMDDAAIALSSDELSVFGKDGPDEIPFVNVWRFLASHTDALPEIHLVSDDRTAIVLEDVGDVPLWEAAAQPGADAERIFGEALDLLADLQAAARDDGSGCYAFRQAFDERLFGWELEHFIEFGLRPDAPAAEIERCREELRGVAAELAGLPRVFCHRDYHAWNLHVWQGRIRIIDFQDALLGPALYDVASLLTDRITPRVVTEDLAQRLVDRFAARAGIDRAAARQAYALCALQRVLKVVGRFNYLSEVKGKPAYAAMLPDVVPTARRLAAGIAGLQTTAALLEDCVKDGLEATR
jgi:aminoglycoside/choline kinase family phosphotransferase